MSCSSLLQGAHCTAGPIPCSGPHFCRALNHRGIEGQSVAFFQEVDDWFLNKSLIAKDFEVKYGPLFPLITTNDTEALYRAQGKLEWLWLDQTTVMATVGPCIVLQVRSRTPSRPLAGLSSLLMPGD